MRILTRALAIVLSMGLLSTVAVGVVVFAVSSPTSTVDTIAFDRPLRIPPVARSHVEDGTRVFDLTADEGTTELRPGQPADTWGYNGSYLGPTLRATRGEKVRVDIHNELDEVTTVHWHGMHLPARFDGGPHQPIEPGEQWSPHWRIDQPAATLWYHPHPHGETEGQVNRGLAGLFLVDDPTNRAAQRLPHDYGVDDIPVIVQDKRFDGDGDVQSGGLGDEVLVNGTYGPYLDVTTEKVRLRLLNASVKRVFDFGFSDDRAFELVGTDSGLVHDPARMQRLLLSPGERAEIVVTMRPGEQAVLRSFPRDLGGNVISSRFDGSKDEFDVLQLRAAERFTPAPAVPDHLAPAPDLDTTDAPVRTFELRGRQINDKQMDMGRIDETVEVGTTEIWKVTNTDGEYHNFHVHDTRFEVLDVDGRAPGPALSGWKDTIFLPPGRTVRLALRFTDYTDPDTPYMYHCHLLQHEDAGMMGQFVVVRPGEEAGTVKHMGGAEHTGRAGHAEHLGQPGHHAHSG